MDIAKSGGLLPGMLNPLVLKAISLDRLHGYGVLLRIQQISEALKVKQGSLYPALPGWSAGGSSSRNGASGRTDAAPSSTA